MIRDTIESSGAKITAILIIYAALFCVTACAQEGPSRLFDLIHSSTPVYKYGFVL